MISGGKNGRPPVLRCRLRMPTNERELVDLYDRIVRYFVGAWRFEPDEARDLAQDVFLSVLRHMKQKPESIEDAWRFLRTAAHHRAVNEFRSRGLRRSKELVSTDVIQRLAEVLLADAWTGDSPPTPADLATSNQQSHRLRDEIEKLSTSLRHPLLLWLEGHSYDAIANALRLSVDAVRTRLRDAKKLLGQRLGRGSPS